MRVPNSTFTAPRDTGGGPQTEGAERQASERSVETEALCQSGQTGGPHSMSCGNLEEGEKGPGGQGGRWGCASKNGSTLSSKREKGQRTPSGLCKASRRMMDKQVWLEQMIHV